MRRRLDPPEAPVLWPMPLRYVPFEYGNAEAVHRLLALGTTLGGGHVPDFDTWLTGFKNDPEFDPTLCFVVVDAQDVIAVAQCWTSAFIRNLVVHPRGQRQGIGERLLSQVFSAFAGREEGQVDLKVMESNLTARRLYERAGMHYVQRCELDLPEPL